MQNLTLAQIRARTCAAEQQETLKDALRRLLIAECKDYSFAVTLTLKQTLTVKNDFGTSVRTLQLDDVKLTAQRFKQKLNREVFGKCAAGKYNKSLRYQFVIEGQKSHKHLHLHIAIGGKPAWLLFNKFPGLVASAAKQCPQLDKKLDVQVMDSGWMEYVTKELGNWDLDNWLVELS